MVKPNQASRLCWAPEATPGTAAITIATSLSYEFGGYDPSIGKWTPPKVEQPVDKYYHYNSRMPFLTKLDTKFPTFKTTFNPVTAQYLNWILKTFTDAGATLTFAELAQGLTYPLTIRHEESEGTNPALVQAVGCYCVGLYGRAAIGDPFIVECEWAWQKIEDQGDRNHLTTSPLEPGALTTPKVFDGRPQVVWDVAGADLAIPEVIKAEFRVSQEFKVVSSKEGDTQTVYLYKYNPIEIILTAVFETDTIWDDYIDRVATKELSIKVWKPDMTNYITHNFTNVHFIDYAKTGIANKGHYESVAMGRAEIIDGVTLQQVTTPADHYKGVVV